MTKTEHPKLAKAKAAGRNVVPGNTAEPANGDGFKRTRLKDGAVEELQGKTWRKI